MEYLHPASVEHAIEMLSARDGQARIVAGGTDLMLELHKRKLDPPAALVDITRIPGLDQIAVRDKWVTVGAAVTCAMLRESDFLRARVPALAQAAESLGAAPIQAMATWVGNICQAMPAADGGVAAVALQAEARVVDQDGARWVPVESLYKDAKSSRVDPTRQMVSHLRFHVPRDGWGCGWKRFGRRPSLCLPILNCAATAQLSLDHKEIVDATIALGPVAALPFRAPSAEAFLAGQAVLPETIRQAAEIAASEAHPHSNPLRATAQYRSALIPVIVREALTRAIEHARLSRISVDQRAI